MEIHEDEIHGIFRISMHDNECFGLWDYFCAQGILVGNLAVHYFTHGILIPENVSVEYLFSCIEFSSSMHDDNVFMAQRYQRHHYLFINHGTDPGHFHSQLYHSSV